MGKIGLRIFSLSILLTYVVVPLISNQLGLSQVIYGSKVESVLIYENLVLCIIPLCFLSTVRNDRSLTKQGERNDLLVYLIIIYVLFLIFSNFREMNVGVQRVINILFPQAVLMSLLLSNSSKQMLYFNVLVFSFCMLLADSRGLLLMSVLPLLLLKLRQSSKELSVVRIIILCFTGVCLFGLWGAMREESTILFSGLFRLSEPYWYYASANQHTIGISEILMRLTWAITRVNIFSLPGSIDGHDFYVEEILKIESNRHVSLPITLIGQGRLWLGFSGAAMIIGMVSLLIVIVNNSLNKLGGKIGEYYSFYLVIKIINLHAKSLSGAWSYICYETIRDLTIFLFIYIVSKHVFRRTF